MLKIFMGNSDIFLSEAYFTAENPSMSLEHFIVLHFMRFLLMYFYLSHHCWLLLLCFIFYVDFVQEFNFDVRNSFLKSSLIGWGVPFITTFLYFLVGLSLSICAYDNSIVIIAMPIAACIIPIPLKVNFIIYLEEVYALFFSTKSGVFE